MLTNDEMSRMPWTRHLATDKEIHEWLASRKAAGEAIDIETCELGNWYINEAGDPYDLASELRKDEFWQFGKGRFVRSPGSLGWVNECDLPLAKYEAMYERMRREAEEYCKCHLENEAG